MNETIKYLTSDHQSWLEALQTRYATLCIAASRWNGA